MIEKQRESFLESASYKARNKILVGVTAAGLLIGAGVAIKAGSYHTEASHLRQDAIAAAPSDETTLAEWGAEGYEVAGNVAGLVALAGLGTAITAAGRRGRERGFQEALQLEAMANQAAREYAETPPKNM